MTRGNVCNVRPDNLLQLCRHHHRLAHEGGLGCERLADGKIVFLDQRDDALPEFFDPISVDEVEISGWIHSMATEFEIDGETCVPRWYAGSDGLGSGGGALFACSGI
jgi:hypothetical protein